MAAASVSFGGVRTDGIDDEDSEQDPQGDVHYAVWGKMEEGKAKDVAEFQGEHQRITGFYRTPARKAGTGNAVKNPKRKNC